eukprot:scaffold78084_cov63-Phaeocystis_antarctica.AAC.2
MTERRGQTFGWNFWGAGFPSERAPNPPTRDYFVECKLCDFGLSWVLAFLPSIIEVLQVSRARRRARVTERDTNPDARCRVRGP